MILKDLSSNNIINYLHSDGLAFRAGSFTVKLRSKISSVAQGLITLYGDSELISTPCDFNICLTTVSGIRKYIKPQVQFYLNGIEPFSPLPFAQALPLFEWGLNWCVTNHYHECLVIHAAVVEKNGLALILPGQPGSGKSTLCAALVEIGGWRLLSDELTLVTLDGSSIVPNPRPVSLKNQSISIVKSLSPLSLNRFTATVNDTLKGSVAHLQPSTHSVNNFDRLATPALIVYPKYQQGVTPGLTQLSRGESFIRLADHSFNYSVLGLDGFNALSELHEKVHCYEYVYDGNLAEALTTMDELI